MLHLTITLPIKTSFRRDIFMPSKEDWRGYQSCKMLEGKSWHKNKVETGMLTKYTFIYLEN